MKRKCLALVMSLPLVLFVCSVNTVVAHAASTHLEVEAVWHDAGGRGGKGWWGPRFGTFARRIAGVYLVRSGTDPDNIEVSLRLISLTADGNWSGTHAQQQAPDLSFSDQHGVWKRSGRREITATVLDFDLDPATGQAVEVVRVRYIVTFSTDLQTVAGESVGKAFALDQDPLDPDEIPARSFEGTFTGRRVTVEWD